MACARGSLLLPAAGPCFGFSSHLLLWVRFSLSHLLTQVESLDQAISLVNANKHGNGTAIFTRSGAAARKFQHEVDVGMVSFNAAPLQGLCCAILSLAVTGCGALKCSEL